MTGLPPGVKMTPMLSQYTHWKSRYPDCILFFRMGDFYEMFFDDARVASELLDITLTARDQAKSIPMAGVPWHSMNTYLGRLIRAGHKVAICEQTEAPDGKTLVDRQVVRIVTPGTYVPEEGEGGGRLAAVAGAGKNLAVALLSSETGRLEAGVFSPGEAPAMVGAFAPTELLHPSNLNLSLAFPLLTDYLPVSRPEEFFSPLSGTRWLTDRWDVPSLTPLGVEDGSPSAGCAAAALKYFSETQFGAVNHVRRVYPLRSREYLHLDGTTQRNLELVGDGSPSLYGSLNRCKSPMGRRTLEEWILRPLLSVEKIEKRQSAVEFFLSEASVRRQVRDLLAGCRDVERATARLVMGSGNPRDLGAVRDTLRLLPALLPLCAGPLGEWTGDLPDFTDLGEELSRALEEDLPRTRGNSPVIREGYDDELDEWRRVESGAEAWLEGYLERIREETGIPKIKAGYNKVFGYYLEVSRASAQSPPPYFIRKQTLVNAERFITEEMKVFEEKMEAAGGEISRREGELYDRLVEKTGQAVEGLQALGRALGTLDALASFAEVAREKGYVRPAVNSGFDLSVKNGRHPVVEDMLTDSPFVPNSIELRRDGKRGAIITGPNMAGKSTYLRSAALLVIMAQMGSFIPAEGGEMGLCDRIFTRIGARDDLARGASTFMVEMTETANILHNVTERSLVILDEVGRGTSTYDGMSIAWAVLEYLAEGCETSPKVLFATHYHELTCLAERFDCLENLSMAVKEQDGEVFFLHQVVKGAADRSYGIEVARLAGLPGPVLRRAFELLEGFEREECGAAPNAPRSEKGGPRQMTLFNTEHHGIVEELAAIDPDGLTPFRALELLYKLSKKSRETLGS